MHSEKITKVKFRDNGLSGLEVTYETVKMRGDQPFRVERKEKCSAPVNEEVLNHSRSLKKHVIDICKLNENLGEEDIHIVGVTSDADSGFIVSAKVRSYGDAWFAVNTPNMKEELEYDDFFDVIVTIREMYDEIRKYLRSDKKVNLSQLALDLVVHDKKTEADVIQQMTPEEKEAYAIEYLTSKGHIVIENEDPGDADQEVHMEAEGELVEEVVEPVDVPETPMVGFGESKPEAKVIPIAESKDNVGEARKRSRSMS